MTLATRETELTAPVALCDGRGRLRPEAIGFSRVPLHDPAIPGRWGRRKRWHHYCVTTEHHAVTLTLADLDYLSLVGLQVVDLARGTRTERVAARPGGLPLPAGLHGSLSLRMGGITVALDDRPAFARLSARARGVELDLEIERPAGHETLSVVVPWDARTFQLTSKHTALPARGHATVGGRRVALEHAFGCLDFGRGVWPFRTRWNWGSAAGLVGGRRVGFNLGGRWTDGTGSTENGLVVEGRLQKLSEPVRFLHDRADLLRPWRIESASGSVSLGFRPAVLQRVRVPLGLLGASLDLAFGHFTGRVLDLEVPPLSGWAEDFRARW